MSSETITRNDLTNIINEIFPATTEDMTQAQIDAFVASLDYQGTPMRRGAMTLLWTNPNMSGSFAAQTISLDLTDYDIIEIYFYVSAQTGRQHYLHTRIPVGVTGVLQAISQMSNGSYNTMLWRGAAVATNGITFSDATYRGANVSSSASVGNDACFPIKIYGIKI